MLVKNAETVQQAYSAVAEACELGTATRAQPWAATADSHLLDRVLKDINKDSDRILDLGCCGYPWVTNYLHREGYNVVGADLPKIDWFRHDLVAELGVPLVAYDGERLPLNDGTFDLVIMFGVLEHVGVWKEEGAKYSEPNEFIWEHRRKVLREVNRVLSPSGTLYLTKFPNRYGRDKLQSGVGHLNSERSRPSKLKTELSRTFHIEQFFMNGIFPHRIPCDAPTDILPSIYARADHRLSNIPLLSQIAQNYCAVATPIPTEEIT